MIALDADGVLLDCGLAYASAWQRAFGVYPSEKDPHAYWPIDRWDVERLEGERLDLLRSAFDENFFASIPAVEGAAQACQLLNKSGYDLICVTALPEHFRQARERNLREHGFPIDMVHATGNAVTGETTSRVWNRSASPRVTIDDGSTCAIRGCRSTRVRLRGGRQGAPPSAQGICLDIDGMEVRGGARDAEEVIPLGR